MALKSRAENSNQGPAASLLTGCPQHPTPLWPRPPSLGSWGPCGRCRGVMSQPGWGQLSPPGHSVPRCPHLEIAQCCPLHAFSMVPLPSLAN